jgi:hypothetical protein
MALSTLPASPPIAPRTERSQQVKQSLENAEVLVAFASRNALKPHDLEDKDLDALIQSIAQARASFDAGGLDSAAEAKLFSDLRHLATAFLPVTVASIRDSSEGVGAGHRYFFWGAPISDAAAAVRRFAVCSFVALLILLAAQIIWLAGYDVVTRWRALQKEDVIAKEASARQTSAQQTSPTPTATSDTTDTAHQVESNDPAENRRIQQEALMYLMTKWWNRFGINLEKPSPSPSTERKPTVTPPAEASTAGNTRPEPSETPEAEPPGSLSPSKEGIKSDLEKNIRTLVAVETEVNIIQTYVLPLLYGLLGACAYVLRQLALEIRARTFRRELGITYWLHIFLGGLAGLAIGWFLRPEGGSDGLIRGLTPFALSFLAGYSVEVLFSGMDRLVAAFSSADQKTNP